MKQLLHSKGIAYLICPPPGDSPHCHTYHTRMQEEEPLLTHMHVGNPSKRKTDSDMEDAARALLLLGNSQKKPRTYETAIPVAQPVAFIPWLQATPYLLDWSNQTWQYVFMPPYVPSLQGSLSSAPFPGSAFSPYQRRQVQPQQVTQAHAAKEAEPQDKARETFSEPERQEMGQEAAVPESERQEVAQEDKKQKQQHKRSIKQAHNAAGTTKISRENIMAWCVWKNYLQGEKLVTGRNEDMTVVYVSNKDDNVIMQVADDYTRMLQEAAYEGFQQEMCQYRQDLLKGLSLRVAKQKYESTDQFRAVKTFNQKLSQAGLSTKPAEVCSLEI